MNSYRPAIENAEPRDAVALTSLINLAYRVEDFFKAVDRTTLDEVRQYLEQECFLVVRGVSGELEACLRLRTAPPEAHFGMLSVRPDMQGYGLGRRLVAEAESRARRAGCSSMTLEVASPRTELLPFYKRLGYTVTGQAPWPATALQALKQPAHFIIMSKPLGADVTEDDDG